MTSQEMNPGGGKILFSRAISIVGFLIILLGVLVLGYQFFLWLKISHWIPLELRVFWQIYNRNPNIGDPAFSSLGMKKIVGWLLDVPLSGGLILAGLGIVWVSVQMRRSSTHPLADREKQQLD